MTLNIEQQRHQAHAWLEKLPPAKLGAVYALLEVMIADDEELTDEDRSALRASDQYFQNGGEGIAFEHVVADLGFTMNEIRDPRNER